MSTRTDLLLEKAIELIKTMGLPEGTASNHLISYEFKSSDLSSYTRLLKNLVETELASVQKPL